MMRKVDMSQLEVMTISFIIAIQIFIEIEIIENLIKIFEVFSQDKFFYLIQKIVKWLEPPIQTWEVGVLV